MKTRYIAHNGLTLSLEQWAKKLSVSRSSLITRLAKGWTVERALSTAQKTEKLYTYKGKTQTLKKWAKELNVRYNFLALRMRRGMTVDEAFGKEKGRSFEEVDGIKEILESVPERIEAIKEELFTDKEKARIEEIKRRRAGVAA